MKKIIASLLAAALLCSLSATAFAQTTVTTSGGKDSAEVTASYQAGTASETVYNVDVAWQSMTFTYTAGSVGTWSPEKHDYTGTTIGTWSETNNAVTVTNHSNVAVDATLSYGKEADYTAISGTFAETSGTVNDGKLELATAAGTLLANAPTATAALKLNGELASGVTNTKIGTVTVTINEHTTSGAQDGGSYGRG